jgi:riboflavin transporter FmnP
MTNQSNTLAAQNVSSVRKMTVLAMFAAISTLLMYLEMPLPFLPPFLKLDISGAPVLIASFMFGPASAVAVTAVKDLVHLLSTQTGGVGELADFIILSSFAIVAGLIYRHKKTRRNVCLAIVLGSLVMAIVGTIANKFLLIPFFAKVMPLEAIIGACNAVNPAINSLNTYLIFGVFPFNLIKAVVISFLTFMLYKRLSCFIKPRVC